MDSGLMNGHCVGATPGVSNVWGRLCAPAKVEVPPESSKQTVRRRVWEFMERHDIAAFPRPVYQRIPNFRGARDAAEAIANIAEFAEAKVVQVGLCS